MERNSRVFTTEGTLSVTRRFIICPPLMLRKYHDTRFGALRDGAAVLKGTDARRVRAPGSGEPPVRLDRHHLFISADKPVFQQTISRNVYDVTVHPSIPDRRRIRPSGFSTRTDR
jgi:hypothetical protein